MTQEGYVKFLETQRRIYQKFADESHAVKSVGVKRNTLSFDGGYLIALRHEDPVNLAVENLSRQVNGVIPSVLYTRQTTHTTLLDYDLRAGFEPDKNVLESLRKGVLTSISGFSPSIIYDSWLINQNSFIAKGMPNEEFYELLINVTDSLKSAGINPRMGWGAHITAGRFREDSSDLEKVREVTEKISSSLPMGESKPKFMDIGHFTLKDDEFNFHVYERVR